MGEGLEGRAALERGVELSELGGASRLWPMSAKTARLEKILAHPDVKLALRGVCAEVGFELPEALELWAGHIRGGNYAALRDWIKAALPQEPKRVDVRSQHMTIRERQGEAPVMRARAIGDVIEGDS